VRLETEAASPGPQRLQFALIPAATKGRVRPLDRIAFTFSSRADICASSELQTRGSAGNADEDGREDETAE